MNDKDIQELNKLIATLGAEEKAEERDIQRFNKKVENRNVPKRFENRNTNKRSENKNVVPKRFENRNTNKRSENRNVPKRFENRNKRVERKPFVDNKVRFPRCNTTTKTCELTKSQLCKAITQNYVVRSKIIAAILTALPRKGADGKYYSGFCHQRLNALEKVELCLPPEFKDLDKLPREKRIAELLKYIDRMDEKSCRGIGGYYKKLNATEKEALLTGNNEFNKFYRKFTQQLRSQYVDSLNKLMEVLKLLQEEKAVSNATLNEISKKAKSVVDNMYTQCQMNYMYAILAFIKADLETTRKVIEEEQNMISNLGNELN